MEIGDCDRTLERGVSVCAYRNLLFLDFRARRLSVVEVKLRGGGKKRSRGYIYAYKARQPGDNL